MRLLVVTGVLLGLVSLTQAQPKGREPQFNGPSPIDPRFGDGDDFNCPEIPGCKADVALVIDKSASIYDPVTGYENWDNVKMFTKEIMKRSNLGEADDQLARYAIVLFDSNVFTKAKLNTCFDMTCMNRIIDAFPNPGESTNTEGGLQRVLDEIFKPENGDRPDEPNILLLMTDGVPNPHNEVTLNATAKRVRDAGIRIVGLGVGDDVDDRVMTDIVSPPAGRNYFKVTSFDAIMDRLNAILGELCRDCSLLCWAPWSPWSQCSATCDGGTRTRRRTSVLPNRTCDGDAEQSEACNSQPCCEWGQWNMWSQCSASCGGGTRKRSRSPMGSGCQGDSEQSAACNTQQCETNPEPECPKPDPCCCPCEMPPPWYRPRYDSRGRYLGDYMYDADRMMDRRPRRRIRRAFRSCRRDFADCMDRRYRDDRRYYRRRYYDDYD